MSDGSFRTGYKKPPTHGQFTKGRSGNPKGRPRKEKEDDSASILDRLVSLQINGKTEKVSLQQATLLSLLRQTLEGKPGAAQAFLKNSRSLEFSEDAEQTFPEVQHFILDPETCDSLLLAIGAIKEETFPRFGEVADNDHRLESWLLEAALRRRPKLTGEDIYIVLQASTDPGKVAEILARTGYLEETQSKRLLEFVLKTFEEENSNGFER